MEEGLAAVVAVVVDDGMAAEVSSQHFDIMAKRGALDDRRRGEHT